MESIEYTCSAERQSELGRSQSLDQPIAAGGLVGRMTQTLFWGYLIAIACLWLLIEFGGGELCSAMTVVVFSPRWMLAIPLLLFVPYAIAGSRWRLCALCAAGLVLLVPIMGFRIGFASGETRTGTLRVLSCNVQGTKGVEQLLRLQRVLDADILALQECDPRMLDLPAGWHQAREGRLLIASRYAIGDVQRHRRYNPPSRWPPVNGLRCRVDTPDGFVAICAVHQQSPRPTLEKILSRRGAAHPVTSLECLGQANVNRQRESAELKRWLFEWSDMSIVMGDFNMSTESHIYRRNWRVFSNGFSTVGRGFGYSKWTDFKSLSYGIRIDHILTRNSWKAIRCWVGADVGSDHRPVIADLYTTRAP